MPDSTQTTLPPSEVAGEGQVTQVPEPTGERPAWLPEKYKTPEELAKSYSELEGKLGTQGEELGRFRSSFQQLYEAGLIDEYGQPKMPATTAAPVAEEGFNWEKPEESLAKREERMLEKFGKLLDERLNPFVGNVADNTAEGVFQRVKVEMGEVPEEVEVMARKLVSQLKPEQRLVPQAVEGMIDMALGAYARKHRPTAEPPTPGRNILGTFNLSGGRDSGGIAGGQDSMLSPEERYYAQQAGLSEKEYKEQRDAFLRDKEQANKPDRL